MKRLLSAIIAMATLGLPALSQAEPIVGLTTTGQLITFDSATPGSPNSSVAITGLQGGETLLGIDFRPATGDLYGLGSTSRLYVVNTTTGAATQVGSSGAFTLSGTAFGFDFLPNTDRLRVVSNTGQNIRLNPNSGALAATDTALAFAGADPNAGRTPRVVGAAQTNNFNGAVSSALFDIDSSLDILVSQAGNTGVLTTIGPLGFETSDFVGFDISGISGLAFASLTAPAGNFSNLFTIDLGTGAATLVGTIGSGNPLVSPVPLMDIAAQIGTQAVPEPATIGWLGGALVALGAWGRRLKPR
jgi:hypothetical protein